jgi:hypothetical protein
MAMAVAMLLLRSMATAQIPVEVFAGNAKTTVDIMFFKYFRNSAGRNSRFLFFNRNRASVDYSMTATRNLPQFGFTEAFSYNHPRLKGFAPVVVAQVLSPGWYTKAGIQYASIRKNFILFSWLVCETKNTPVIDYFLLARYTPRLTERANLFAQAELINALPTDPGTGYSFTQRLRLGVKIREFQFGAGADFNEAGRNTLKTLTNIGAFLRYEF